MRGLAILNLVIVFTIISYHAGWPFMGQLFEDRGQDIMYQWVMGNPELGKRLSMSERMERNAERFADLPDGKKAKITKSYEELQLRLNESWYSRLSRSFKILAFDLPALERTWLFLSFILSLLILFEIEGIRQAVWLLPLLAICFAIANQTLGYTPLPSADHELFPTEEWLIEKYIQRPLSQDIAKQRVELTLALNNFFIQEWANETPSNSIETFNLQVEKGEFAFHLARLEKILEQPLDKQNIFDQKRSWIGLFFFLLWNFLLAWRLRGKSMNLRDYKDAKDGKDSKDAKKKLMSLLP
jgi:hypothetical protein